MNASPPEFGPALLRLKESLNVQSDKAVASLLGLSPTGFNDRKRRNAFPADKLYALASRQPNLRLDVCYVLTGETQHRQAIKAAASVAAGSQGAVALLQSNARAKTSDLALSAASGAEQELVQNWRRCRPEDQATIRQLAARLAQPALKGKVPHREKS